MDAGLSGAHRADLQPVRFHHRHLGRWFRKTAGDSADGGDAVDLPGRQFLFDQHAAAVVAEGHAVQPGGVSDQRLPLEFLRQGRCAYRSEHRHDVPVPAGVPGHRGGDLPQRLPAQGVSEGCNGLVGRILVDAGRCPGKALSGSNARCPHRSRDTP
ncbi:hypothetical protein XFF6166_10092 [Xanthomonas citri pv. fuscans]|nr:hypothetical protein XFF6166_10092 [Xanthomonas citri pv. fuscans]SOO06685.1 hypothetical protein XFF7767_80094 [Xanthomonas citri pv. fuscans]SOO11193.1 hypothetical protein XFF6970_70123 [Xanthomonas citri pv. fuscans]SOO16242.1 hypothetical protein XFF7766_770095 [Xanthomonas citri pv. fuscans]